MYMENKTNSEKTFFKLTIEPQVNQSDNINLIKTVPTETLKFLINPNLLKQTFRNSVSSIVLII